MHQERRGQSYAQSYSAPGNQQQPQVNASGDAAPVILFALSFMGICLAVKNGIQSSQPQYAASPSSSSGGSKPRVDKVVPYSGVQITAKANSKAVLSKERQNANKEDVETARGYNKKRRQTLDKKLAEVKEKKTVKTERIDPKTGKVIDDDTFIRESLAKLDPIKAKKEKLKREK